MAGVDKVGLLMIAELVCPLGTNANICLYGENYNRSWQRTESPRQ